MANYRIYPKKSNTIASGIFQNLNSGQNAITELWYGGGGTGVVPKIRNSISRFLMYFDLTDLKNKINSKEINPSLITSYKLHLTNAIPSDKTLQDEYEFDTLYKKVAVSFDLICFPINKDWDEGRGYDLIKEKFLVKQAGNPLISGVSNWNQAQQLTYWDEPGVFTNPTASTTHYSIQHFDIGDENIEMDVTDIIDEWISGGQESYGLAIAYNRPFEEISGDTRYISAFYTEKTNTAFKPFIEVNYNQAIVDDRKQISNNRPSNLFLYTFSGHNPVNIYNLSAVTVDIKRGNSIIQSGLTPIHYTKGVYYINIWLSGATAGETYTDVWKNVSFSPYDVQDISNTFQIQKNYFTSYTPSINDYVLDIYGIDNGETVRQDENIRIFCDARINYSANAPKTKYDIEYQILMNNQIEVTPWTKVNQIILKDCQKNYFDLDASWLLHNQTYKIFLRIKEMGTYRVMPNSIDFKVIKPF